MEPIRRIARSIGPDHNLTADAGLTHTGADKGCQINIQTTNRIEARAFGMLWWDTLYFLWGFRGVFGIVRILHTYRDFFYNLVLLLAEVAIFI